ncbi:MAG TPA: ABC transporter ATP-binding protein, partial [Candidatus Bathyarchaeia archaeon]
MVRDFTSKHIILLLTHFFERRHPTEDIEAAVSAVKLWKVYDTAGSKVEVLKDVNFRVLSGEFVAIRGASGSGKTTLLNLISGIDKPSCGQIRVFGEELTDRDEDFLADLRCKKIGFVFQAYNLISTLTVAENVAFPMEWARTPVEQIEARVEELLDTIGMEHRSRHFPAQLSGGEQQRVAFARALANDPPLLLADEPTGNLDARNSQKITEVLG